MSLVYHKYQLAKKVNYAHLFTFVKGIQLFWRIQRCLQQFSGKNCISRNIQSTYESNTKALKKAKSLQLS